MKNVVKISFLTALLFSGAGAYGQEHAVKDRPLAKVLLFKWKDNVGSNEKTELTKLFRTLVDEVDGFESFEVKQVLPSRFETVYILKFSSESAERAYRENANHERLATLAPALVADFSEYQYWR